MVMLPAGILRHLIFVTYMLATVSFTALGFLGLGFYGAGILYLWPGILFLMATIGLRINARWEIVVSVQLLYVLLVYWSFMIANNHLTCLAEKSACQYLEKGFIGETIVLFVLSVTTVCLLMVRLCMYPVTIRNIVQLSFLPAALFGLLWTLGIGFIIWIN